MPAIFILFCYGLIYNVTLTEKIILLKLIAM